VKSMSSSPDEVTMILVVRDDLKLSKGKLAAQCAHGAVNCALKARKKAPRLFERWNNHGARKIVVRADDESHLRQLYSQALTAGLVCDLVKDAGRTEIPAGTITVLGIGPATKMTVDAITSDLKLL